MHAIAAKSRCIRRSTAAGVYELSTQRRRECTGDGRRVYARRSAPRSGGTDTHLMLVDDSVKGLTGKAVEEYLDLIGITVNKNAIPFDKQKPFVASGIRIGTPGNYVARLRRRGVPRGCPYHLRRVCRYRNARATRTSSRARARADLALRRAVGRPLRRHVAIPH